MPRCLSAVLLACACALLLPSAADAAYDLTISNAPTDDVTITNPTNRVTVVTATGPGATLNVGELATRMASSASSDALRLASGAGGTEAGDVTLTAPLTSTGTLDLRNTGVFTIDADLSVGTLNGFSGGGVVASTPSVTASSTMLFEDPLQLAADVTLRGGLAMLQQGARGGYALRAETGTTQIEGDVGSAAAPVASFTTTHGLLLEGTVHATGGITVGGDLQLLGNAGLRSATGAVDAGRAFDEQTSAAYDLTLAGATVVRFAGATTEPPRTLAVTAPSVLLSGSTTARSQTWNGHVTTSGDLTLKATLNLKLEDGLTIGAGRTVRVDGGEGSWVRGRLRGTSTSTLEVDPDPVLLLTSPAPSDPVAIVSSGVGRLDVLGTFPGAVSVIAGTIGGGPTLGPLTLGGAATIEPGQVPGSPATLTAASLTLQAGATVRLRGRPGVAPFDKVHVLGNASLGGATLSLPGAASAEIAPGASISLVEVGGAVTGAFTGFADGDLVGVSGGDATYRLGAGGASLTRPKPDVPTTPDAPADPTSPSDPDPTTPDPTTPDPTTPTTPTTPTKPTSPAPTSPRTQPAPVTPVPPRPAPGAPTGPVVATPPAAPLGAVSAVRTRGTTLTFRQRFAVSGRVRWRVTANGKTLATRTATVTAGTTRAVTLKLKRRGAKGKLVLRTTLTTADGRTVSTTRRL